MQKIWELKTNEQEYFMANPSAVRAFSGTTQRVPNRFVSYSLSDDAEPKAVFRLANPKTKTIPGSVDITTETLSTKDIQDILSHSSKQTPYSVADLELMNKAYAALLKNEHDRTFSPIY